MGKLLNDAQYWNFVEMEREFLNRKHKKAISRRKKNKLIKNFLQYLRNLCN